MTVKKIFFNKKWFEVSGNGYEPKGEIQKTTKIDEEHIKKILYTGVFTSNAKTNPPDEEHKDWYCLWDPTEWALITLAKKSISNIEKSKREPLEFLADKLAVRTY